MNYSVSASGKVQFADNTTNEPRGVYGIKVEFWFFDEDNSTFYHPVSGNQQHVHYDIVDEAGNYSFNFSFTGDLSEFESIIFDVSYENDAAHIAGLLQGQLFEHSLDPNDPSITFSKDLQVFADFGAVLRYMMLARELVYERYNGNPPFGFGSIKTYVRDLEGNTIGLFRLYYDASGLDWDREISIDQYRGANVSTIMHEYGHWMHERLWDSPYDFTNASDTFTEGWAVFFSFAGRNYAAANYGDALLAYDDNTEEDAFETGSADENGDPYRFAGMDDAFLGHPEQAAFSCALWSLYDGYNNGSFEVTEYDEGDNDDVSGYGRRVFDAVIGMDDDGSLVSQYFGEFKSGLSGNIKQSVNEVYDFMFSDYVNVPTGNPMRPAQVENASVTESSGGLEFQWEEQSYPSGRDYGNYEAGYRLYRDGNLIATLPRGTTNYTHSVNDGTQFGLFEITSYNSAGNASKPEEIDIPAPLDVALSGPTQVQSYSSVSYEAIYSGGEGPYTIRWYDEANYPIDEPPEYNPGNPAIYTKTTGGPNDDFYIQVEVEAHGTGEIAASPVYFVDVVTSGGDPGNCPPFEPCDCPPGEICQASADSLVTHAVAGGARALPDEFALEGNYPNPFSGRTKIAFALPEAAHVELAVYDLMGRKVLTLIDAAMEPGYHHATFEAQGLPSGVYLYRIRASEKFADTGRMVVVR